MTLPTYTNVRAALDRLDTLLTDDIGILPLDAEPAGRTKISQGDCL